MKIIQTTEYRDEFLEALNILLPQLSPDANPLRKNDLRQLIESEASTLFFAVDDRQFSGTLTLVLFKTPTGKRARIEDFIVDRNSRRQGVGKLLIENAINIAKRSGARTIDLTSHPSRKAANAFYKKTGFEIRKTNVFFYKIT